METLIRKRFVGQVLQEEGDRLIKNQRAIMEKRLQFHSGHLVNRRQLIVISNEGTDGKLSFSHINYERFLDMKRTINRKRTTGTRVKQGYRIHNRFIYGTYFSIAQRLMYDFTDEIKAHIMNEIKSENNG